MAKKNMQSIAAALQPVAQKLPTQNVVEQPKTKKKIDDPIVQFGFGLRKSLRREISRMAEDHDLTMRGFILKAMQEKGINVTDEDFIDKRKDRK